MNVVLAVDQSWEGHVALPLNRPSDCQVFPSCRLCTTSDENRWQKYGARPSWASCCEQGWHINTNLLMGFDMSRAGSFKRLQLLSRL
jgi:hypothetical protein